MRNPYSLLRIIILLILTVIGAEAQTCCSTLTQAQINTLMAAIQNEQEAEVPGTPGMPGECFSGVCYPQEALAGDMLVTTGPGVQSFGSQGQLTDINGDVWSLVSGGTCDANTPNWWWAAIWQNGVQNECGYYIAMRILNDGHVWVEEAKQGGWWDKTIHHAGLGVGTINFTGDPGPGPNNVGGGGGGGGGGPAPGQATINEVLVGSSATLQLANGTVLSIDLAGNIDANGVAFPGGGGSKAVGANVVPDNIIWGEDAGGGLWFTAPSSGGAFTQANPQPIINAGAAPSPRLPTLQYQDIINGVAGPWLSLPAGSSVTATSYSFTHPAVTTPAASFAVSVRDANNTAAFGTSNTFVIAGASGADARQMCSDVGAAVNAANPGVLIICEGPITNSATLFSGGANQTAFVGDLSAVARLPVTGIPAGKLVYSVHDYPANVSGQTPDGSSPTTATRNVAWGYLETSKTAAVWIGAMGASLDGTNGSLIDDQGWAALLVSYLNGGQSAGGGPIFTGTVLPMSTNWWSWGNRAGENPDGTLNADGSLKTGQQAVWSNLLYKIPAIPKVTWDPGAELNMALSGNNLIATSSASLTSTVRSIPSKSSGKLCYQIGLNPIQNITVVGLANSSWSLSNPASSPFSLDILPGFSGFAQSAYTNGVQLSIGTTLSVSGDAVTICVDLGARLLWFTDTAMRVGDSHPWNNDVIGNQNPALGIGGLSFSAIVPPYFIEYYDRSEVSVATLNATGPFAVTTPAGFSSWDSTATTSGTRPSLLINLGVNDNLPPAANDNVKVRLASTVELGR